MIKKRATIFLISLYSLIPISHAQMTREDYARAERFLYPNIWKLVFKVVITPHWIGESASFWYKNDISKGKEFILVDPAQNIRRPAFDHDRLAAALSVETKKSYEPTKLPFDEFEYSQNEKTISFTIGEDRWQCELGAYGCKKAEDYLNKDEDKLYSPDEKWAAFIKDHDLYLRELASGEEFRLTSDGKPYFDYGSQAESNTRAVTMKLHQMKLPPVAIWSPDSKKLITHKLDQREVKELHLLQHSPPGDSKRPLLHAYRYPMPGDERVAISHYMLIDVEKKSVTPAEYEPQPVSYESAFAFQGVWWSEDSRRAYFIFTGRGSKFVRLCEVDAQTGKTRLLIEESSPTQIDLNVQFGLPPNVKTLGDGSEFIWFSERDGWGHLYPYDGRTGELKNLEGKLLISCGEMDDNIHPALTIQLIDALIKENKDFDMLYFPNNNHGFESVSNYRERKTWDYFMAHLL